MPPSLLRVICVSRNRIQNQAGRGETLRSPIADYLLSYPGTTSSAAPFFTRVDVAPKNPAPTWERGGRKRERATTGVDLAEQQEPEGSRQRRQQQREAQPEAEPEPEQDQDINFLHIDDWVKEVDMSPNPSAPASAAPHATPESPGYSQITRYATPNTPKYSQLLRPFIMSPIPLPVILALMGSPALHQRKRRLVAYLQQQQQGREEVYESCTKQRPEGRKGSAARPRTEEQQQRLDSLKAAAKAANKEAKAKKAAARSAEESAQAQRKATAAVRKEAEIKRKEEQKTAKQLAAKKEKNKEESQSFAEQTQQVGFGVELPFRSSQ
ncbi:MAG: hypothetical protein M1835_001646 [Candelina submexicana]|nr:MAG: hypothetical protein M1835_001646 [Candelina submexicana]